MQARWWHGVALGVAVVGLVAACGLDTHKPPSPPDDDVSEFSASALADPLDDEEEAFLTTAERDALERDQAARSVAAERATKGPDQPIVPTNEGWTDRAGKFGLAVLSVGMTVGAAVAPFFLF